MTTPPAATGTSEATEQRRWLRLVQEDALDPDRPLCDAHLHLFGDDERSATSTIASHHVEYGVADFLAERAGHNVVSSVFVETHEQFTTPVRQVDPATLRQIEQAEAALRALGLADLRVRHHGDVARIELLAEDLERAVAMPLRADIQAAMNAAGFRFCAVDLAGIQSGAFTLPLVASSRG